MKNILLGIAALVLLASGTLTVVQISSRGLTLEAGWPFAWGVIFVVGGLVALTAWQMVTAVQRGNWGIAWKASFHGLSWSPLLLAVVLLILLLVRTLVPTLPTSQFVEVVIPLAIGVQSAFLLSPDDEPMIETVLAAPRPFVWVLVERLIVLFAVQGSIALVGTLLTVILDGGAGVLDLVIQWLPPAVLLSGIGLIFTLTSRQPALSAFMVMTLLFMTLYFGDLAVQRWPIAWFMNPYANPASYGYALNRVVIGLIGIGLIIRAASILNNPERWISNARQSDQ